MSFPIKKLCFATVMLLYQRVNPINPMKPQQFPYGFPMVFLWFLKGLNFDCGCFRINGAPRLGFGIPKRVELWGWDDLPLSGSMVLDSYPLEICYIAIENGHL